MFPKNVPFQREMAARWSNKIGGSAGCRHSKRLHDRIGTYGSHRRIERQRAAARVSRGKARW